jgi:hypothetical protein
MLPYPFFLSGDRDMHAHEWKLPADFDAKIREWMAAQGWKANSTRDYLDEEVYAWRQDTSTGSSPTLWIARGVIDKYEVGQVTEQLDSMGVAARMRTNPRARFLVTEEEGKLVIKPWPRPE